MSRSRNTLAAVLFIALLLVPVGCSRGGGPLEGTQWRLVAWTLSSLNPTDFTITAAFSGGRISGKCAVNSYGGPYKAGPGSAFSVGELVVTLMAGPEPAMRAERAYLTLLAQARSYEVADGTLTLYDGGGNESLIFEVIHA